MQDISQVNGPISYINTAEFVKLNLHLSAGGTQINTFSSSYRPENINGVIYTPLGGLLGISTQQRDLKATSFDTAITLSGIDQEDIYIVLSEDYQFKGSEIEIYRGFYGTDYELGLTGAVYKRYTGIITSFNITEAVDNENRLDTYTVSFNCSNYKTILANHQSGRNTNPTSWNKYYPDDLSMNNVPSLMNARFNFGKKA